MPDWSVRIPALDGLRGIAILLVLLHHSVFGLESSTPFVNRLLAVGRLSWSGVDLFFVLSGFLIGGILLDARASTRYYQTFYIRRAYRILPLYFLVAGIFLFRHLPVHLLPGLLGDASPLTIPWYSYLTFIQNFFMAHKGWYGAAGLAVTWSLAIEEQFYLVAPLFVRLLRGWQIVLALLLIIAGVPALRFLLRHTLTHGDFACYVLMPCRADDLCLGVLSAYGVREPKFWNLLIVRRSLLWALTGILFAGVILMTHENFGQFSAPMTLWGYSLLGVFYTFCLLITVSQPSGKWHRALCTPWLMQLGTLAYCLYLLHYPLIQSGRRLFDRLLPDRLEAAYISGAFLAVILSLTLAAISWRYYETPLLRRGRRYRYF